MLNNVVIYLLGDEDPRVRHVAAASLVRYLPSIVVSVVTLVRKHEASEGGKRGDTRRPWDSILKSFALTCSCS